MTAANLIGALIFGSIGMGVFIYGKRQSELRMMIGGFLLMAYPYVVPNTVALYGIGVALTVALLVFRE